MHALPLTPLPFRKTLTPISQQKFCNFSVVTIPFPWFPPVLSFPVLFPLQAPQTILHPAVCISSTYIAKASPLLPTWDSRCVACCLYFILIHTLI